MSSEVAGEGELSGGELGEGLDSESYLADVIGYSADFGFPAYEHVVVIADRDLQDLGERPDSLINDENVLIDREGYPTPESYNQGYGFERIRDELDQGDGRSVLLVLDQKLPESTVQRGLIPSTSQVNSEESEYSPRWWDRVDELLDYGDVVADERSLHGVLDVSSLDRELHSGFYRFSDRI